MIEYTKAVPVSAILSKQHYLLYLLVPAIQPRFLITFEEETSNDSEKQQLKQVNVNVRQGQVRMRLGLGFVVWIKCVDFF